MSLENEKKDVVDEMKEDALEGLESLSEEGNSENKKVIEDAKEKMEEIFKDLQEKIKNTDKEKIKEDLKAAKEDAVGLLEKTKERAVEVSQSETFKETVAAGKDFLSGAGTLLTDLFKSGADKVKTDPENTEDVVEELHEEALAELDTMAEDGNTENKKVLEDAREKIDGIFKDLQDKVKNTDKEKIKEGYYSAKEDVINILNKTKDKAIEVSQSDSFKDTMAAGKDFVIGAGGLIGDAFKAGADTLMKNDDFKNFVEKTDEKLDTLRESQGLKNAVDKAEEITGKVSGTIFGKIKQFFDKEEKAVEQSDTHEENNDL